MKFNHKLRLFMLPAILVPAVVVIAVNFVITGYQIREMQYELLRDKVKYFTDKCHSEYNMLKSLGMDKVDFYREASQKMLLEDIRHLITANAAFTIVDMASHAILFSNTTEEQYVINHPEFIPSMMREKTGVREYAMPLPEGGEVVNMIAFSVYADWGWLVIGHADKKTVYQYLYDALAWSSLIVGLFIMLCFGVMYKWANGITRSLELLERGTVSIAEHNFDVVIDIKGNDEFSSLAKNFKMMASALKNAKAELVKAKDKAEESESRLRTLSDNLPGGLVYQIDSDEDARQRRFSYVSAGVEHMHGVAVADVMNDAMIIYEQVIEEDRPTLAEREAFAAANMIAFSAELRFRLPDGEIRWRFLTSAPRRLPNHHIIWDGVEIDITERKKIEESLVIKDYALSSAISGIAIADMKGYLTYINPSILKMWGFKNEAEVIGMHATEFWQEKEKADEIMKKLNTASYYIGELKGKKRDGALFDAQLSASIVKNRKGVPISIMASFLDISEQRKLEDQLNNIRKLESIGILAGGIAHDFNNMLGVIVGNISYALSIIEQEGELFEILNEVQTGTKQAQTLTQQLLTFAKGGAPLKKNADIREILKESALFITRGSNVRCEFLLAENLWTAAVDTGQINQAISNLVINATQAMPEGGVIQIKAGNCPVTSDDSLILSPGLYVKISLQDSGIGIPANHLSRIFDPYFTTKPKGSGIGLATTYSIIKRHNGHISATSIIGQGTTFDIYLPAAAAKPVIDQTTAPSERQGHEKILIMDDQESLLLIAERILRRLGYETAVAKDGKEAIEIFKQAFLEQQPFDLVILDLTIPGGMGGAKTITELLKIDPQIKAIVSSGYSNDPIMANYQDYGFCDAVPKPFTKAELVETLNRVFGKTDTAAESCGRPV